MRDIAFVALLLAALALRVHLATTAPFIHDEINTAIPLAKSISFDPRHLNLPLRGENHGALPAYVVKVGSTLFGTTMLGYRLAHILLGLCTVVIVFALTRRWYGVVAARWAAALFAFNEYYLPISARATAQVPTLFFDATAIYAFSRFLDTQRTGFLYAAGGAVALAFYCKESSALLLPIFLLTLVSLEHRRWLLRPQPYVACAVFALLVAPDVYWNLTTNRETARVGYQTEPVGYATYQSHLQRIGGLGFSPYPAMFYAREPVKALSRLITGRELNDETTEYQSVNPLLGLLLFGAVVVSTFQRAGPDDFRRFLLLLFWGWFGFFTLITRGNPPGRLDPVSWIWVEVTLLPAVILAGARFAEATGRTRLATWVVAASVLLYAAWTTG